MLKCCPNNVFEVFVCYFHEKVMVILRWLSETGSSFVKHQCYLNKLLARVEPRSRGVGGDMGNSAIVWWYGSSGVQ